MRSGRCQVLTWDVSTGSHFLASAGGRWTLLAVLPVAEFFLIFNLGAPCRNALIILSTEHNGSAFTQQRPLACFRSNGVIASLLKTDSIPLLSLCAPRFQKGLVPCVHLPRVPSSGSPLATHGAAPVFTQRSDSLSFHT